MAYNMMGEGDEIASARFEVITTGPLKIQIFWGVTLCGGINSLYVTIHIQSKQHPKEGEFSNQSQMRMENIEKNVWSKDTQ